MKITLFPFHGFVIPFLIGVAALLAICLVKYVRWFRHLDESQRDVLRHNWYSWKIIPAVWEMITEGLFHRRILKKNLILGLMHQAFAMGWFLLIVVGAVETNIAFSHFNHEQSIERYQELEQRDCWHVSEKPLERVPGRRITMLEDGTPVRLDYQRPFYIGIFYRYFVHKTPTSFVDSHFYANLMDGLLLYVFFGLTLAAIKIFRSKILGLRRTTKHSVVDRFAKFSLWMIFPLRLLAESVTACLYGNGGFFTQMVGNLYDPMIVAGLEESLWMFYSLMLMVFFICIPFTRYMHIFTELFLIWLRKIGIKESDAPTGYTRFELNACSRCGVCIQGCPMDKTLDNHSIQAVYLIRGIRGHERQARLSLVADNCLMCDRCQIDCPVGIDISALRRQVRDKGALDTTGNYSYLQSQRKPFNAMGRVAYFGGCMSHLTPGITEAMEKIFQAAGQPYWYIDKEKSICCGRPLRQQGFLRQAAELRERNTQLIEDSGVSMLVTSCPICYRSFKQEYDLKIPVMHHTEYLELLLAEDRIRVRRDDRRVSYHDPCELGRGCGIYEEPRNVLRQATNLVKNQYQREKSICCGFNLGNTVLSVEEQTRIRNAAMADLMSQNPDAIATACPMCKKAFQRGTDACKIQDIAEIVAQNLIEN